MLSVSAAAAGSPATSNALPSSDQALEAFGVEGVRRHMEDIAGRAGLEQLAAGRSERPAQPRDVCLHGGCATLRKLLSPELFEDPVGRDDLVCVQEQQRQQCPLPPAGEAKPVVSVHHLERPEDPELHTPAPAGTLAPALLRDAPARCWSRARLLLDRASSAPVHRNNSTETPERSSDVRWAHQKGRAMGSSTGIAGGTAATTIAAVVAPMVVSVQHNLETSRSFNLNTRTARQILTHGARGGPNRLESARARALSETLADEAEAVPG